MTPKISFHIVKREISRVNVVKVNVILFLSVCITLGQSSSCCTQLQLHADTVASVSKPAVSAPRLLYSELLHTCTFVSERVYVNLCKYLLSCPCFSAVAEQ